MEWPVVPIEQVAEINPKSVEWHGLAEGDQVSFVPMHAVSEATASITTSESRTLGEVKRGYTAFREGDVLFAKITPCMENGKVAIARNLVNGVGFGSTEFHVLRAGSQVLPEFLYYFVRQPTFRVAAKQQMRGGAGQQRVPELFLRKELIPLPPLSEQGRIVEILDQADRLRRLRAEADAKADRILPALFIKMFGDPATNPMGWPVVPLRQLGRPLSGGAFPLAEQGLGDGEVPFIKVSDMNTEGNEWFIRHANNYVSRSTLKRLKVTPAPAGTIVFPKIGAAVATNKKRLLVQETAYDNNVIGVLPKAAKHSAYLFGFFQMFDLRTLARSTALPSIKTSELARVPIPKPSPELAEDFAARLATLARTRDAAARTKRRLEQLFKLMMHQAFSGSLTASWREAHMKELLQEMEQQAKALEAASP